MKHLSISKIKQIRSLQQKKFRDESQLFVVEGEKMVEELLQNNSDSVLYCVHTAAYTNTSNFPTIDWYTCDEETLKKCSTLTTPNKVLAVVQKIVFQEKESKFILALDSIQDPGNMGTIMRTADWYGIEKIICSKTTVDVYNPKVIQASMGAFLRIPVEYIDLDQYLQSSNMPIYGALLEGKNVYEQELSREGILLMGNEGKGISEQLIKRITHPVTIPRMGGAESLNVSIATAILLSEFSRKKAN